MKIAMLILSVLVGIQVTYAQSLKPEVLASSGDFYKNENYSLSWTIGEGISETLANANNKLSQGFQQGIYDIDTEIDNTQNLIRINLFPNPATDFVNLEIQLQNKKDYFYQLFDSDGKCLKNGKITSEISEISLLGFSTNTYFLKVISPDQNLLKSFKILKIN